MTCSRLKVFIHIQIPNAQNENHVLVEVVEATAMMHHTQLELQDIYNHHWRWRPISISLCTESVFVGRRLSGTLLPPAVSET